MTSPFGRGFRSDLIAFYVVEALFVFAAVYPLSVWSFQSAEPWASDGDTAAFAALIACCAGLVAGAIGLCQPSTWPRLGRVVSNALLAGLILLPLADLVFAVVLAAPRDPPERFGVVTLALAFAAAIALPRLGFAAATRHGLLRRRIAVVLGPDGAPPAAHPGAGFESGNAFTVAMTLPSGAPLDAAITLRRLRRQRVWAVVAANGVAVPPGLRRLCDAAGVQVLDQAALRERRLGRVEVERLPADWLATARAAENRRVEAALRRGLDVAVGLGLVLLTLPVLLLTALAIKLDSPGPVFYRQERVGLDGRPFMLLKFRSMVVGAEAGGKPQWASRGDPRVTRVGRFIRLTRIDEVPQVLNVLRGDMAMVGPRPERPCFTEQLGRAIPRYHDRACVKPGITGWAQVSFPYGSSVDDARMKLAYDLYYVRRRSLFFDLFILAATVRVVLFGEGAR